MEVHQYTFLMYFLTNQVDRAGGQYQLNQTKNVRWDTHGGMMDIGDAWRNSKVEDEVAGDALREDGEVKKYQKNRASAAIGALIYPSG